MKSVFVDRYIVKTRPAFSKKNPRHSSSERGMSLIEIMVVLVIIALVSGGIGLKVMQSFADSKISLTKMTMRNIINAYPLWQEKTGGGCLSAENIETLRDLSVFNPPAGKKPIADAWGRPFKIICPAPEEQSGIILKSLGPDGQEGTPDDIDSSKL